MDHPQVGKHSLHNFIACTEVNSFLCLKYFLNKDEEFSVFRLILAKTSYTGFSWVIEVIEITWRNPERIKGSIIWRQHLPMQRNGGGQIGIVVQNMDTSNTSTMAKIAKQMRTYCKFDPIFWLCKAYHTYHDMESNI